MRRRTFIAGLGATACSATAWPRGAHAQQQALPVVGFISVSSREAYSRVLPAFGAGLSESGYADGRNIAIDYHWLEGQNDRVPAAVTGFIQRRVAAIVAPTGGAGVISAAKAANSTIPIVAAFPEDPVRSGLVASLARPGGNVTGMNFFSFEVASKRLGFLHQLVSKAVRIGVLVNPASLSGNASTLEEVENAASGIGLSVDVLKASTNREIEAAFATLAHERIEALYIVGDPFFTGRRVQFATLSAHHGIATAYSNRDFAEAGGLMAYGADFIELFHQIGTYTGRILKGAKPADLPVVQSTKFEFVINLQTARALGIDVPPTLLAIADEVIE